MIPAHRRLYQARALNALLSARTLTPGDLCRLLEVNRRLMSQWTTGTVVLTPYWIARIGLVLRLGEAETVVLLTAAALVEWERRGGVEAGLADPYRRQ